MTVPKLDAMHAWLRYTKARYAGMARQAERDTTTFSATSDRSPPAQRVKISTASLRQAVAGSQVTFLSAGSKPTMGGSVTEAVRVKVLDASL
jgi:hypothetical protein